MVTNSHKRVLTASACYSTKTEALPCHSWQAAKFQSLKLTHKSLSASMPSFFPSFTSVIVLPNHIICLVLVIGLDGDGEILIMN